MEERFISTKPHQNPISEMLKQWKFCKCYKLVRTVEHHKQTHKL